MSRFFGFGSLSLYASITAAVVCGCGSTGLVAPAQDAPDAAPSIDSNVVSPTDSYVAPLESGVDEAGPVPGSGAGLLVVVAQTTLGGVLSTLDPQTGEELLREPSSPTAIAYESARDLWFVIDEARPAPSRLRALRWDGVTRRWIELGRLAVAGASNPIVLVNRIVFGSSNDLTVVDTTDPSAMHATVTSVSSSTTAMPIGGIPGTGTDGALFSFSMTACSSLRCKLEMQRIAVPSSGTSSLDGPSIPLGSIAEGPLPTAVFRTFAPTDMRALLVGYADGGAVDFLSIPSSGAPSHPERLATLPGHAWPSPVMLDFDACEGTVFVGDPSGNELSIFPFNVTPRTPSIVAQPAPPIGLAYDPYHRTLFVASSDGKLAGYPVLRSSPSLETLGAPLPLRVPADLTPVVVATKRPVGNCP